MAYRNESRNSGFIDGSAIMHKASDNLFEKLISQIRGLSREERCIAAQNTLNEIIKAFQVLWDEDPKAFLQPLFLFIVISGRIGSAGLKQITPARVDETAEYFKIIPAVQSSIREDGKKFFDYDDLADHAYQQMVEVFLCASLEPLDSTYPTMIYQMLLLLAFAGEPNEAGINVIRRLRSDYMDFAEAKKTGRAESFTGKKLEV